MGAGSAPGSEGDLPRSIREEIAAISAVELLGTTTIDDEVLAVYDANVNVDYGSVGNVMVDWSTARLNFAAEADGTLTRLQLVVPHGDSLIIAVDFEISAFGDRVAVEPPTTWSTIEPAGADAFSIGQPLGWASNIDDSSIVLGAPDRTSSVVVYWEPTDFELAAWIADGVRAYGEHWRAKPDDRTDGYLTSRRSVKTVRTRWHVEKDGKDMFFINEGFVWGGVGYDIQWLAPTGTEEPDLRRFQEFVRTFELPS